MGEDGKVEVYSWKSVRLFLRFELASKLRRCLAMEPRINWQRHERTLVKIRSNCEKFHASSASCGVVLGRGDGILGLTDVGGVTWDRILHQRCVSDCFCRRSV